MLLSYTEMDDGFLTDGYDFRPTTAEEVCEILKHAQFISNFHDVAIKTKSNEIEIIESWRTFRHYEDNDFQECRIWTLKL